MNFFLFLHVLCKMRYFTYSSVWNSK